MSKSDVFERFRDYFQGIADAFEDNKLASQIFPNTVDAGSTREDIFMAFLKRHIPTRCGIIKGGFIFDSQGNESKQIDLIVTNDLTLNFKNFEETSGKAFTVIEGCYAAISVKSNLTKETLYESLDGFASIPAMPSMQINPLLKNTEKAEQIPHRIVFAFNGIELDTLETHLLDYHNSHKIPLNQTVDYIIVNNKYIIQKTGKNGMQLDDGTKIPPYAYFPTSHGKYIGAFSLWVILTALQTISNYGSQILFNFKNYDDELFKAML